MVSLQQYIILLQVLATRSVLLHAPVISCCWTKNYVRLVLGYVHIVSNYLNLIYYSGEFRLRPFR